MNRDQFNKANALACVMSGLHSYCKVYLEEMLCLRADDPRVLTAAHAISMTPEDYVRALQFGVAIAGFARLAERDPGAAAAVTHLLGSIVGLRQDTTAVVADGWVKSLLQLVPQAAEGVLPDEIDARQRRQNQQRP